MRVKMAAVILGKTTSSGICNSLKSSLIFHRGVASKLFIGGLSFHTTEKTLTDAFTQYGQVIEAKIIHDRVSERSKGFGFVTYASSDEADKALDEMDGKQLDGRIIFVDQARPYIDFGGGVPIARGPPENSSRKETAPTFDIDKEHS